MPLFGKRTIRIYNGYERSIFVKIQESKVTNVQGKMSIGVDYMVQLKAGVKVSNERLLIEEGFIKIRPTANLPFTAKEPYLTIRSTDEQFICECYPLPGHINNWIVDKDATIRPGIKGKKWVDEEGAFLKPKEDPLISRCVASNQPLYPDHAALPSAPPDVTK